jgi:phosphoribosylanthranilate isomerase
MVKVKICGLKTNKDIECVLENGGSFFGCIFFNKSSRFISLSDSKRLNIYQYSKIGKVAVFVNPSMDDVSVAVDCGFDIIQLHGNESVDFIAQIKEKHNVLVIKAFGVDENFNKTDALKYNKFIDYYLFDSKTQSYGGSGVGFNWRLIDCFGVDGKKPFFLSGGIGSTNVVDAIKITDYIDISSSVESSLGVKDCVKIKKILEITSSLK